MNTCSHDRFIYVLIKNINVLILIYLLEGTDTEQNFAPVLRAAAVPVLDQNTCRKEKVLGGCQQTILDSMLCAGELIFK